MVPDQALDILYACLRPWPDTMPYIKYVYLARSWTFYEFINIPLKVIQAKILSGL